MQIASTMPSEAVGPLLEIQQLVTMEQAVTAPLNRDSIKVMGEQQFLKFVCAFLKLFCESLNIKENMNMVQLIETAQFWIADYPTESLKDLILCLKLAKKGAYGPIYNRFDSEVFNSFFRQYLDSKAEYRESKHKAVRVRESSGEMQIITQIAEKAPEALQGFKRLWKGTPALFANPHNEYVEQLKKDVKRMSDAELVDLRAKAKDKKLIDVETIVVAELNRRTNA